MSEEEDHEPTILEYARFYGIALDHLERNPLQEINAPDDLLAQLADPQDVFHFDDLIVSLPLERICAGSEAAILLSCIPKAGRQSRRFDEDLSLDNHRFQKIRVELPILFTDHELDLQDFAPQVIPDLEHEYLPLEKLDEEADEGFAWPSAYQELPDKFYIDASSERLILPKEGLLYLQDVLTNIPADGVDFIFECDELSHGKVRIEMIP